ncbi:MAG: GntR family transcriptional regulator [Actinomycetia bacterium]|nr:GntR family transcriptional regulator [Actinomycetes bacterium]MCP4227132.1 GntR family transcriptional regulator [Actinomycetes bacterium]MCP5033030.1 GntR family transcriptional regulator [Actinomycetes bacterium]
MSRRLRDGDFALGDQLPSEYELAAEFGVSRATVRTAIGSLVQRGLVVQRRGIGNFAAIGARLTNDLAEAVDFNVLVERSGSRVDVVFDDARLEPAPDHVADALGIGAQEAVFRAAKRFMANENPLIYVVNSISESVLGPTLAAEVVERPDLTEPLFTFLEHSVGVSTSFQLASLRAELGSEIDYPGAELDSTIPVLRFEEVGYTAENRAIWHSTNWFPPSAMQFELVRRRVGAGL